MHITEHYSAILNCTRSDRPVDLLFIQLTFGAAAMVGSCKTFPPLCRVTQQQPQMGLLSRPLSKAYLGEDAKGTYASLGHTYDYALSDVLQ